MKPLTVGQLSTIIILFVSGVVLVLLDLMIVSMIGGYTIIALAILLLFVENGFVIWYWWVSFGFGVRYTMTNKKYTKQHDDIISWLSENLGKTITYYHFGENFYFLRETDAVAFKLMWE